METLNAVWTGTTPGSGLMLCLEFFDDTLILPSDNGNLSIVNLKDSTTKQVQCPDGTVYYVSWAVPNESIWLAGPGGLTFLNLAINFRKSLQYYDLTCCKHKPSILLLSLPLSFSFSFVSSLLTQFNFFSRWH
jgi:hypothetical protein